MPQPQSSAPHVRPAAASRRAVPRPDPRRLALFIACLTLTVAATAFSLWYNLNHATGKPSANVFSLVSQEMQTVDLRKDFSR